MGFLIDTCIWIDVERGTISPHDVSSYTGTSPIFISPITIAELTFGAEIATDENVKQKRMAAITRLKNKPLLLIDEITGSIFGNLAAAMKRSGRSSEFRVQDVWLASQAIQYNYKLLTSNKKDFIDIPGLNLVVYGE
jgi:predicted nucleic acid-binding protein